jgi:hypothetical protein
LLNSFQSPMRSLGGRYIGSSRSNSKNPVGFAMCVSLSRPRHPLKSKKARPYSPAGLRARITIVRPVPTFKLYHFNAHLVKATGQRTLPPSLLPLQEAGRAGEDKRQ